MAPASWLVKWNVVRGRREFNFSEWDKKPAELDELLENIESGEMPPIQYTLFHPNSWLDEQQKQALIEALSSSMK